MLICRIHPRSDYINVANKGPVCRQCFIISLLGRPKEDTPSMWAYYALRKTDKFDPNILTVYALKHKRKFPMQGYA